MLFGHYAIDKTFDEYVNEIALLAKDGQTLVFIDTNILSYLYKLHGAAREEFFAWSDTLLDAGRLFIPTWVANEYLSKVTSKSLESYTHKSNKEPSQAIKSLNNLYEIASLFVDEASLRNSNNGSSRERFLTEFRENIDVLSRIVKVFNHQPDAGSIHHDIVTHLSPALLDSDVAGICIRASQEGPGRFEHRIPPGFRDGGKGDNCLGDLIIWFEILEKSLAVKEQFPKVLFITRDEKIDWVYAPIMRALIKGGKRITIPNQQPFIKLADPRLVSEFKRITSHENLTIVNFDILIEGLSQENPELFINLAAAIQIETEHSRVASSQFVQVQGESAEIATEEVPTEEVPAEVVPAEEVPAEEVPAEEVPAEEVPAEVVPAEVVPAEEVPAEEVPAEEVPAEDVPAEVVPAEEVPAEDVPAEDVPAEEGHDSVGEGGNFDEIYTQSALRDSEYQADAPSQINEIIRDLKSLNWYTQNPAIMKIDSIIGEDIAPTSLFVLGRNIYQAACGNSQKAMDYIDKLESKLSQLPPSTSQHLLSGILFEIYFNSSGQYRSRLKFSYADKPLSLATRNEYVDSKDFITYHLREHMNELVFKPGDLNAISLHVISKNIEYVDEDLDKDKKSSIFDRVSIRPKFEITSILLKSKEILCNSDLYENDPWAHIISGSKVSMDRIRDRISNDLAIPKWALEARNEPLESAGEILSIPDGYIISPRLAIIRNDN